MNVPLAFKVKGTRGITQCGIMLSLNKKSWALSETSEIETDEGDYVPVFTDNFRIFTSRLINDSVFESY